MRRPGRAELGRPRQAAEAAATVDVVQRTMTDCHVRCTICRPFGGSSAVLSVTLERADRFVWRSDGNNTEEGTYGRTRTGRWVDIRNDIPRSCRALPGKHEKRHTQFEWLTSESCSVRLQASDFFTVLVVPCSGSCMRVSVEYTPTCCQCAAAVKF